MSSESLEKFVAYQRAMELFDVVVEDMSRIARRKHLDRLVAQQLASADSIAANIEEGYGRASRKEYIRFLVISRGSARETRGRYIRLRRWYSQDTVSSRLAMCDEIIAILSKSITTLSRNPTSN